MRADSHIEPSVASRPLTKRLFLLFLSLTFASVLLFAQGDGKWLRRVPDEDHARHNPLAGQPQAVAAGRSLFAANCARCHNTDANGRTNPYRPSLRSERIRHATDGDLFWMLKNGNPYKGMPPWWSLPEAQRWQIIAYLRSLPPQHK